ncbi:MAG: alpha-L-rhamnosidase [Sphingobacteriales bacterium 50-39]|nr:alpha-L-rhamnosidase [Sphingobacteriales bacterium]OJW58962.1 MAG: alpha-L-rhamnosidase [Sphingobacteriales bacterium 50-39]
MKLFSKTCLLFLILPGTIKAQLPPVFEPGRSKTAQSTETVRRYLSPVKIVWRAENVHIENAERLLLPGNGQADLANKDMCVLRSEGGIQPALLLDFGRELHGGLQIVTGMHKSGKPVRVRVRFGESASEAMSEIEPRQNATNDHAMRDEVVQLPWLGKLEIGNTGFRFVRIDLLDADAELQLKEVRAIFTFRDLRYLGSFHCSDTLLDKIWLTGAYTVQLNMQDYLWDGIKRDRLVWVGDMHPETSTISAVFGNNEIVPKSLDLSRDITPLPAWMNGISTYSMWWIIIHRDWYYHNGNLPYLQQQKDYLVRLLAQIIGKIDSSGREQLDGTRFLDWPSSENKKGVDAGLQAMMIWALTDGADLCRILDEAAIAARCEAAVARLKKNVPDHNQSKQAAALMALTGLMPAQKANDEVLAVDGAKGFSTFYGYYMLQAMAKAGNYQGALDAIRSFWGGMLNLGATTFWEDFNLDWLPNASRIDELPKSGQKDIHGDYGAYCYVGFRHSLCHGWASGPTPWLTQYVLGISVVEPGAKTIRVEPHLGDLQFAEGSYPTPYGLVKVKHVKQPDGRIASTITAPKQVKVIRGSYQRGNPF